MQRCNDSAIHASFNLQFVVFDDRIAQQLVRRVVDDFVRRRLVRAGREVDLDVFADMDTVTRYSPYVRGRFGQFCPADRGRLSWV